MEFSASVVRSCSAYLRKNLKCACHNREKSPKQIANGTNPRTETRNSPKFFGTCRETTSSVSANPKITSLKTSRREIPVPRKRNPFSFRVSASGKGIVASTHSVVSVRARRSPLSYSPRRCHLGSVQRKQNRLASSPGGPRHVP